jgi:hypothetical protein
MSAQNGGDISGMQPAPIPNIVQSGHIRMTALTWDCYWLELSENEGQPINAAGMR